MRKRELDPGKLAERETVVRRLVEAGWDEGDSNALFDAEEDTQLSAEMLYSNRSSELMVGLDSLEGKLFFTFEDKRTGKTLNLLCTPLDQLGAILDVLISMQDDLRKDNFRDKVRGLLATGARIFVLQSDEGGEFAVPLEG